MIPKVSIIAPVYNTEKYLTRCLDSIRAQTFSDFECILVNDCSTDTSGSICEKYKKQDARFIVIHNQTNLGSSQTRRIGLEHSTGDYIIYIDSDDWVEANMLEILHDNAVAGDYDIVWCNWLHENNGVILPQKEIIHSVNKSDFLREMFCDRDFTSALWNKLAKRDIFSLIVFPMYSQSEDIVITLQLIFYANKIKFCEDFLYHHCFNQESLSHSKDRRAKRKLEEYYNMTEMISFLRDKLQIARGLICPLEPELSNYINFLKLELLLQKVTNEIKALGVLYPESGKLIFNRLSRLAFYKKIALFVALKYKILLPCRIIGFLRTKLRHKPDN